MTEHPAPFEPASAMDDELRAVYDLRRAEHLELWAEDPFPPYEQWKAELLEPVSWRKAHRWLVWSDGGHAHAHAVADCTLALGYTETNRNQGRLSVYVRHEARRRGLARALLRQAVPVAADDGRTILNGGGPTGSTAVPFAESLGATCKIVERKSRLLLSDVDRPMLEEWVVRAKERAGGYSMLRWDGPVPDEYLDRFVTLTMVMNTAPRDDLEMEDSIETPKRLREREDLGARQGYEWWTLVVRHDETDSLVGYTELVFPPNEPAAAWQEATAVDPAHRDKGIGRWLKAENCLRLFRDRPDVRYVDTWNAFSNGPMLGINIAMGFQIVKSFNAYQVDTEQLRARLG